MRGKRGQDRCHRKRKEAHTHTVSFQQEDVADACTTLMMLHTISALELDHHTHTLSLSTSFSSHMWLSSSHQIFTVGAIKHSLCSTFICPPPTSLQRERQKPPKKPENMRTVCLHGGRGGPLQDRRRRWDKTVGKRRSAQKIRNGQKEE